MKVVTPEDAALAVSLARQELSAPTLGESKQLLAVHRVAQRDGEADCLAVQPSDTEGYLGDAEGYLDVFFRVLDGPYHLVVTVRLGDQPEVTGMWAAAQARASLSIWSSTLKPEELTARIGLQPTSVMVEGRNARLMQFRHRENGWFFDPLGDAPGELEAKLRRLLELLEPTTLAIRELVDTGACVVRLNVYYWGYADQMGGWFMDRWMLERLTALGAEVDVDLYASGSDLPLGG